MDVFDFMQEVQRQSGVGRWVTLYSLSKAMGISRYKVQKLADVANKRGLCYISSEVHRPGIRKYTYSLTIRGDTVLQMMPHSDFALKESLS